MPGPKTHHIFYKDLKKKLNEKTLAGFPHYDDYSIFAQGHDFLIYHDFYKIIHQKRLDFNVDASDKLQEYQFPEFVYQYLKAASENGCIEEESIRLFLGPGYVMHHLLDAYTHPQIIYYAGDHVRDPKNPTWMHGIIENLIDIYLMEKIEKKDPKTYPVYKDFHVDRNLISRAIISVLNDAILDTYGMEKVGERFYEAIFQVELFIRTLKYDPSGTKRFFFDKADSKLKGTQSFSYHRNSKDAIPYLNLEHGLWRNPMSGEIFYSSFLDLYQFALLDGARIVEELEKITHSSSIHRDDVYQVVPNIASTHGLACNQKIKINYKKG